MSSRLMVNLILNLNIRVKWVADTKINRLENVPKFWDVFLGENIMKKEEQYRRINTLEYNKIVQSIPLLNKIANYFKDVNCQVKCNKH